MNAPAPSLAPAGAPKDDGRAARDSRLATWLGAAAQGDTSAFEAFYDATAGHARTLARRMVHGGDIDDLLADAYFEAWRSVARFDPARGSAVTWLLTIIRSRALDLLRRHRAHPTADPAAVDPASGTDAGADPAERLWRLQAGSRLHRAMQQLTVAERWVLGLAYFRELSQSEIAECTGMPLGTVKSHLKRAQHKLRASLST
jgi:RNA polymerase sigma-70 factor (ECF subfamily)